MKIHVLIATSLVLSSAMSFGAGYQLNLQGLRQLAMGGSGTAVPWDMSTIFYNPGGMTSIDHWQINASALFLRPNVKYVQNTGTYAAESQPQTFTPFNIYAGGPTSYRSPASIGIGIYTPFGSGLAWDDKWRGRYIAQRTYLQTIFIQPTFSYQISDEISAGVGLIFATGRVEMSRAIPITDHNNNDSKVELEGNARGFGFNAGLHIRASDELQLGITFRSQVDMKANRGYASFTVPQSLQTSFQYTPFSATLPLPMVASIGAGYAVNENLTLQADLNYVGWGRYDSLIIDYERNSTSLEDTRIPRRWKNTVAVRVGGHYTISDRVAVMLGAAFDPTPVKDGFVSPDLPDANRGIFTGGITYKPWERWTIMGAFEYLTSVKRVSSYDHAGFQGTYQTKAFTPGIGVSYDF